MKGLVGFELAHSVSAGVFMTKHIFILIALFLCACSSQESALKEPLEQRTVTVENIEQFISAIASDTYIVMKPGYYDIEDFVNLKGYDNQAYAEIPEIEHVVWEYRDVGNGVQMNITGVNYND